MTNRLIRTHTVSYTPGTPYVPEQPAYCVAVQEVDGMPVSGGSVSINTGAYNVEVTTDESGLPQITSSGQIEVSEPVIVTRYVCTEAVTARPATPGAYAYSLATGWDSSARSLEAMPGDGAFRFYLSPGTTATVAGLIPKGADLRFQSLPFAFYVHTGAIDVLEYGQVVATAPAAHDAAVPFAISRIGERIVYTYGDWRYESAATASAEPLELGAVIYLSGDYVDSPELLPGPYYGEGRLEGILPALTGFATDAESYAELRGELPALLASLTGISGGTGQLSGTLPPLAGMLGDTLSSGSLLGTLPALTGDLGGGLPEFATGTLVGVLPPLSAHLRGMTGGAGSLSGTLPPLAGLLTEQSGYGELRGTLPALGGYLLGLADTDYGNADNSLLIVGDFFRAQRSPRGAFMEGLQLADSWSLTLSISEAFFESLMLSSDFSGQRTLSALIQSGLLLGGEASSAGAAAVQYAVNVLTGALTTYSGFGFDAFALAGDVVYASRPDGLYRLRPGDDDGSPISVYVDFGTTDYGSVNAKTVQDVFLGLTTDGEVIVTLRSDGTDRSYKATARGPMMRATAAKGVTARRWNLVLDVSEASEFELDTVEHIVGVAARRWIR